MSYEPLHDLNEVKSVIDKDCCFPARNRSVNAVMAVFRVIGKRKTTKEAEQFIKDQIKLLEESDFCEHFHAHGEVADVYGKIIENEPWYIKFYFSKEDGVIELSFHPPEWEMKLKNGNTINKGRMTYDKKAKMWRVRK